MQAQNYLMENQINSNNNPIINQNQNTNNSYQPPFYQTKNQNINTQRQYSKPVEQDIRKSFAIQVDTNPIKKKQNSIHCRSLFGSMILVGGVVSAIIFGKNGQISTGVMWGIIGGSYFLYLCITCCCNRLGQYFQHLNTGLQFQQEYNKTRQLQGRFVMSAQCYHYQTRYHTRSYTDSNGNHRTQTYTTTQKVVTHTATQLVFPTFTEDASGQPDRIRSQKSVVFIKFVVNYRFKDEKSRYMLDSIYELFKRRNTFDVHQSFSIIYNVPGLIQRNAFHAGQIQCNYMLWFYIFGAVGLIWPYSLWVESKVQRFQIAYLKILTM